MSKRNDFSVSEKLIRSIIFEQSGSKVNAIKEAIQNSLDAGAKTCKITIENRYVSITDDGCGMNAKEIDTYFRIFGESHKRGDETKIGKYGLGRGQIFKCGWTEWITQDHKLMVNAKKYLGYKLFNHDCVKGTTIFIALYQILNYWSMDRLISDIRTYVLPNLSTDDMKYIINGKELRMENKVVISKYSDEDFEVFTCDNFRNRIYSQGLYVKTFNSFTGYNISCKKKMSLNIERSNFLEIGEDGEKIILTEKFYEMMRKIEEDKAKEIINPDPSQCLKILMNIKNGDFNAGDFIDKRIIEMCDGTMMTLGDMIGKNIYFGEKNNLSDKAIQNGYTVINQKFQFCLRELHEQDKIVMKMGIGDIEEIMIKLGLTNYYKNVDMYNNEEIKKAVRSSKMRLTYFYYAQEMNYQIFGCGREISLGESDMSDGWTDGHSEIWINKNMLILSIFGKDIKRNVIIHKLFELLVHEYAHDNDDTTNTAHDGAFWKKYGKLMAEKLPMLGEFEWNFPLTRIAEDYYSEIKTILNK